MSQIDEIGCFDQAYYERTIQGVYDRFFTMKEISRLLNVPLRFVRDTLKKNNSIRRGGPVRSISGYVVDEDFFKRIGDEFTDYWTGMILADGYIWGNLVAIELQIYDAYHLAKFAIHLRSTYPINIYANRGFARFKVSSRTLVRDLYNLGIRQNKTHTVQIPDCLVESRHFWRGVVDGDGHISKTDGRLCLTGNKLVVSTFADFVEAHTGDRCQVKRDRSDLCWRVRLKRRSSQEMLALLYQPNQVSLGRKYLRATTWLEKWSE